MSTFSAGRLAGEVSREPISSSSVSGTAAVWVADGRHESVNMVYRLEYGTGACVVTNMA